MAADRFILGLDIGSNSVGSAWVDLEEGTIDAAVGVFPAGVDESDQKRGAPKNAKRRTSRRARITLARRAERKRLLRRRLVEADLLPADPLTFKRLLEQTDPWDLRRRGLREALSPHEFGRVLLHLAQRRGALGLNLPDQDDAPSDRDEEEGKVKEAISRTKAEMAKRDCPTFGALIATLRDERRTHITTDDRRRRKAGVREWRGPVRNQAGQFEFHADRTLIRDEFNRLWCTQKGFSGPLAPLLTDALRRDLDDPNGDATWRHKGLLFGQRRQSWDLGTLGRCVLEPTDRCVPIADRHAGYFRVIETVNNLRIIQTGTAPRPLTPDERQRIITYLRGPLGTVKAKRKKGQTAEPGEKPKTKVSVTDLRNLLGWGRATKTSPFRLNIESDPDREINTDWFHREIVHRAIGEDTWNAWDEAKKESVNRAVLKFDPDDDPQAKRLHDGAQDWWGLTAEQADRLVAAWRGRPKLEKRLNLSRRAICNLLPYMEQFDEVNNRWPTQQEARKAHAAVLQERFYAAGDLADQIAAQRYATGAKGLSARDRRFIRKHADLLIPPAPTLSNPVVRKAIHEVRRHVVAYLRKYGRKPDRVFIELARMAKQPAKVRDRQLFLNRTREKIRKTIIQDFNLAGKTLNQQRAAVDRVVLARQQQQECPYCGQAGLTEHLAAKGEGCEIDHIVPYSRCGDNGLNNKVLVHTNCNRDKGKRTPREWWGQDFDQKITFAAALFKDVKPEPTDYFTKRDYHRKWENFTREVREGEEWRGSQLTDTAYAARQVMAYLADALFDGAGLPERGGERRIFVTQGRYTAMLRRDWKLFETLRPRREDGPELSADEERSLIEKDRGDHRHHAIDAITIALTDPQIIPRVARQAAEAEEYFLRHGQWPKRDPIEPPDPWKGSDRLRQQVIDAVYGAGPGAGLVVAHRALKRKIVAALHEETLFGVVPGRDGQYTGRKNVTALTPNHLRVPGGWDELSNLLEDPAVAPPRKEEVRRQLAALPDPLPGKSGIVRDRALRDRLRKCLRAAGLDPDCFTANQLKRAIDAGALRHPSGVPIKRVILLRTMSDPVIIPRRRWDPAAQRMVIDHAPTAARVYVGGNNHHVEIRADQRGRWSGQVVTTFDAARRVRIEKRPAVDRADEPERRGIFVMSLAEGETVYMKHPTRDYADYFVVFKLDKPQTVHFIHHWDARPRQDRKDALGHVIPGSACEDIAVAVSKLRDFAPPDYPGGKPPRPRRDGSPWPQTPPHPLKVRVGPLGDVTVLERD